MPLLDREPSIFPDDLLNSPALPTEAGAGSPDAVRWWVLHTKPRAEKAVARRLLRRGTPFFLPVYQRKWRNRGRVFRSQLPLFPGYVFLFGDYQARLAALETNLLAGCLYVEDQAQLQADLARVQQLILSDVPLSPEGRLQPGATVEITHGPLAGTQGLILRRGKHLKFYVEVKFIQRGVAVEIEGWMLEPSGRQVSTGAVQSEPH